LPDTAANYPRRESIMVESNVPEPLVATEEVVVAVAEAPLMEEDLLVEDVSIDGMCGVY
jgi:mycofactocin precursor